MTLRLGFVGVGKWARKLAESFRACGAEIVAYDRHDPVCATVVSVEGIGRLEAKKLDGFGTYIPWPTQIARDSIDAIIAVAPPEVTTEVALACAAAGKAVMATKPLFDHPETIRAPFYVDFWRLWAPWQEKPAYLGYHLCGSGPVRGYPGIFDYGPHVLAALLAKAEELNEPLRLVRAQQIVCLDYYAAEFAIGQDAVKTTFGNETDKPTRYIWGAQEDATHIGNMPRATILKSFCQSFLNDVSEGFVDTKLLNYSREGMRLLRQIREMAK